MAAHAGVIPIRDHQRPVRRDRAVGDAIPRIAARQNIQHLPAIPCALRLHGVSTRRPRAGVAVDHHILKLRAQRPSLIDRHPRRRTCARLQKIRHHAGIILIPVPQRNLRLHIRPLRAPPGSRQLIRVAVVAKLHHIIDPNALVPVVIVIALPHRPERIHRHLVVVPEIVPERLEIAHLPRLQIDVTAIHQPLPVRLPLVRHLVPREVHHRRTIRPRHPRRRVARIKIKLPVRTEHKRVHLMIVIPHPRRLQDNPRILRLVVPVRIRQQPHIRRRAHNHLRPLPLRQHTHTQRIRQLYVLKKHLRLIRRPVPVFILQNDHPIPLRTNLPVPPVIYTLHRPNPSPMIHIDTRRIHNIRLRSHQRGREPIRRLKRPHIRLRLLQPVTGFHIGIGLLGKNRGQSGDSDGENEYGLFHSANRNPPARADFGNTAHQRKNTAPPPHPRPPPLIPRLRHRPRHRHRITPRLIPLRSLHIHLIRPRLPRHPVERIR